MQLVSAPRPGRLVGALFAGLTAYSLFILGCQQRPPSMAAAFPAIRTVTSAEAAEYAGNAACASCHQEAFREHEGTHHAHALTRVSAATDGDRFRAPSNVVDPRRGLRYTATVEGDRCIQRVEHAGGSATVAATYAFGSGKHAVTYHGFYEGELLELRLSYYSKANRWDFSPGQKVTGISGGILFPVGLRKPAPSVEGCFVCHATAVVKDPGGPFRPETAVPGVGCESCHGPGKPHIRAVEQKAADLLMPRLGEMRPRVSKELCGQCHRSPAGDDLTDPYNLAQLPRFQGLALPQSACFQKSGGRLTCLSCHDAHTDDTRTQDEHNATCRSCHRGPEQQERECGIDPKGDCVTCHMPLQDVGMPTGLKYRNHWIKVWDFSR